jgi:hypothetical protein
MKRYGLEGGELLLPALGDGRIVKGPKLIFSLADRARLQLMLLRAYLIPNNVSQQN